MFFTDTEPIVPVNDYHVLIDDDWGVAAVFQDIALQRRKLLRTQGREQSLHLRQHNGCPLRVAVFGFRVLQSTISFSLIFESFR